MRYSEFNLFVGGKFHGRLYNGIKREVFLERNEVVEFFVASRSGMVGKVVPIKPFTTKAKDGEYVTLIVSDDGKLKVQGCNLVPLN